MWHIGDLQIKKGVVETYIASPIYYFIRYITCSYQMMVSHHKIFFANDSLMKPLKSRGRNDETNIQTISRFLFKNQSIFQKALNDLKEFDKAFYHKIKDT